jgi:hypothetical protein
MAVEHLFWFRPPLERLQDSERGLLSHAVAMVRAPAVLRAIDADACQQTLLQLRSLAAAP